MCNNMQHNLLCDFSFRPAAIKHKIPLFVFPIPPPLYHHSVHSPLSPFDLFLNVPHASLENWVSFGSWPKPIRIFSGHPKNDKLLQTNLKFIRRGQSLWELWFPSELYKGLDDCYCALVMQAIGVIHSDSGSLIPG